MPNYRLFRLSPDNQIFGVSEVADFDSDRDVVDHAKRKMDGLAIEVLDGPRLVIRRKPNHK